MGRPSPADTHDKAGGWNNDTFRRIFNHTNDGIFLVDPRADLIVAANPRACHMLEYEHEELLEMSITDIVPRGLDAGLKGVGELLCETKLGRRFCGEISVSTVQIAGDIYLIVLLRDVQTRKRMERAEKKLERLASFPELNRHPVIELAPGGEVTYRNPAAARQFPILNRIHTIAQSDENSPLAAFLSKLLERLEAGPNDRMVEELATDDSIFEVHVSYIRSHDLIRIYLHDVTERKRAEAQIAELKSFYQNVLGDLPMEIAVFDREGRYMYLNRAAVSDDEMRQWLMGRRAVDYARRRGLDPELFEERQSWLEEAIAQKETREREEIMVDKQGNVRHKLRIVTPVVNDNGKVRYALGYGLDLTERRKAMDAVKREKEFTDEILNSLDDVFFAYDTDGILLRCNKHACRMTGYSKEEIADLHWAELIPAGERSHLYRELTRGRLQQDVAFETKVQTKSGEILPFEVIGSFMERNGRVILAGIGRDISERKQHERELIEAKERAEEMSRLKSAFLANMSHEIRTPLTAILGFADILEEEIESTNNEFIELIHRSGNRLLHTLDSVLDLAQLEAGSKTITPESVNLVQQIQEPVQMLAPQAESKGLDLRFDPPAKTVTATVDPAGLVRIVTNLVSNAIKFTEEGRVAVHLVPRDDDVTIKVEDTGRGMDVEFQEHLFEAFKQESTGLNRSHDGTGLGLTIVKQLTELMNGRVSVNSKKGVGSTFAVTIPRQ